MLGSKTRGSAILCGSGSGFRKPKCCGSNGDQNPNLFVINFMMSMHKPGQESRVCKGQQSRDPIVDRTLQYTWNIIIKSRNISKKD